MLGLIEATLLATVVGIGSGEPAPLRPPAHPLAPFTRTLRVEAQFGADMPLGFLALTLAYEPRVWLSLGAGIGFDDDSGSYALFARAHPLRIGALRVGPVLTISRADRTREATYQRPQYVPDHLVWSWSPAYRLDAGVGAELKVGVLTLRLEGGLGYVLNEPTCGYFTEVVSYEGVCGTPTIPAYYHFAHEPGRFPRYLSFSLGIDTWRADSPPIAGSAAAVAESGASPERPRWYGGPAVMSDAAALALVGIFAHSDDTVGLLWLSGLTYAVGAPLNHVLNHYPRRAWGSLGIRALGFLLTGIAAIQILTCSDESGGACSASVLLPVGVLTAMFIDDAFLAREW